MATPHALLTHARDLPGTALPAFRRRGRFRAAVLLGAGAALTFSVLPGTALADPTEATTPEQAAELVAEASHQLEVVTEQVNEAKVELERHQADVASAERAAAEAQARLDALDGQIRQLARTVYTGDGLTQLDVLLTSGSAEDFVHQLGTLDAIAGHTNSLVDEVNTVSDEAEEARERAETAGTRAQRTLAEITAKQADLQAEIADYQEQYEALTAAQQQQVSQAHGGVAVAAPSGVVAPSSAAQVAVDTALAQIGDPYVWGAGGPNAFDCSGLVQYAYAAAGVSLPHSSRMQSQMGAPVSRGALQPGDLVFFYSPVSHVGMYIGNGQMVHAATSGTPVQVVSLDSLGSYNGARRIAG